ncbi:MAG: hypothetical protein H6631_03495 [Anaerolineaceae bacterium]|nr:hypothetical protein [Anaerolineaceae bacterium]
MNLTIINSQGYWKNGWVSSKETLARLITALERAGVTPGILEVTGVASLEKALDQIDANSLVLTNAYYVKDPSREQGVAWINDFVEARGLKLIGSGAQTLRTLLQKDKCQERLASHGLPVPGFVVLTPGQIEKTAEKIRTAPLSFPLVVKPTATAESEGISQQSIVYTVQEAVAQSARVFQEFPAQRVILEEFLPSSDVTVGYFQVAEKQLLLPTFYEIDGAPGETCVLGWEIRSKPWGPGKIQRPVIDAAILNQLKSALPHIAGVLNIRDFTRVDGRLDSNGQWRAFDVNGMALSFPNGVLVRQCFVCFPDYSRDEVYQGLVNTLIYCAARRYGIENIPEKIAACNLFSMESPYAVVLAAGNEDVEFLNRMTADESDLGQENSFTWG